MVGPPRFGTFSIVAYDRDRSEWGVAVQSKFLCVGAVVPWAEAGVGAVATQALANVRYGPEGLALLREGLAADEVVRRLTAADDQRDHRQLGVVDRRGRAAAYTGSKCMDWAGHQVGDAFACQGNILFASAVVEAMARTFESTPGDLPERLLAALASAQREGGDRRGMQSAAMLIVRPEGGYDRGSDRWVDVRVDDHPSPIEELRRIFELYDLTLLTREDPTTLVRLEGEALTELQRNLGVLGYLTGPAHPEWDARVDAAFAKFLGENNFENKARTDGTAWPSVLQYLQQRARAELARRLTTAPIVTGALDRGPGGTRPGGSPSPAPKKKR
ncbi:MAG TPA: DUF1028 domain-containing protein [Thermoplasmata archaeon]|nr:DUF1028 domain-containing protein [Thermoplasmata archaeon]